MRRLVLIGLAAALLPGAAAAHDGPHGHAPRFAPTPAARPSGADPAKRRWQAGDHHVHSWYSVSWKPSADGKAPPEAVIAGDANNPIPTNARMAAEHGLIWMVATDHGGPNHSKLNREKAYPEVLRARKETPGLILFVGMELDTPGAEHSSVIVPKTPGERDVLFGIEAGYNRREPWPADPAWDTEQRMVDALNHMKALPAPPVVIANHPSRTANGLGRYGAVSPHELRNWNDAAPNVAVGMEGAPGHQAGPLLPPEAADEEHRMRGAYRRAPTLGGFDQMTAILGGFWDSMLGEGRRWWITSTSDSHRHYTTGGSDFWPGEYSKTYVKAVRSYDDVLDGLRNGRVFVTLGDLVSEVDVVAQTADGARRAEIGGALKVPRGSDVTVVIRVRDPAGKNFGGYSPSVARVDLIRGDVTGPAADRDADRNPTTRVEKRFGPGDWVREGERLSMAFTLKNVTQDGYVRVRGTNGSELEPEADTAGETPWSDLWFYANPIFIEVE
ncbi:phosphoesterase [Phenylobacterium sp.]|uniref:phosphoesterase n=1 Tax=Phenylobacterium sp. TaxID=1871053 RepID=UPI00391B846D